MDQAALALAHLQMVTDARLTLATATRDLGISHARVFAERLSWARSPDEPSVTVPTTAATSYEQRLVAPTQRG